MNYNLEINNTTWIEYIIEQNRLALKNGNRNEFGTV
jgi:hypothetical protein